LEGEVRKAINSVGLELSVGFLHDLGDYQTKQSLVYDLQEPYRWLSDICVIDAFEFETSKLSDFYFTGDDCRYRFKPEPKQRFIDLVRERFNSGASYRARVLKWDTIIEQKTAELGWILVNGAPTVDFAEPELKLVRCDDRQLRARVLSLSQLEASQLGIGKSTLHYLRKSSQCGKSFKFYSKVHRRLCPKNQSFKKGSEDA
jgi:CRISPR-associated protein Cas1